MVKSLYGEVLSLVFRAKSVLGNVKFPGEMFTYLGDSHGCHITNLSFLSLDVLVSQFTEAVDSL